MRLPLIVRTVAVGQYVIKVATTLVTLVVPNSPLVTTPELTLEAVERVERVTAVPELALEAVETVGRVRAVPELALEVEDAAVLEAIVLFDRVTAV